MKNIRFAPALFALLFALPSLAQTPAQTQEPTSIEPARILQSPVFTEHQNEILARAHQRVAEDESIEPARRKQIQDELDELPYRRILDLEFAFITGYPDMIAACLEGHLGDHLAIEGCASSAVLITSALASVKYPWDLVKTINEQGRVHQLSLGPSLGVRQVELTSLCFFGSCSSPIRGSFVEYAASLEYVSWRGKGVAFTAQLDLGVAQLAGQPDPSGNPKLRFPTTRLTFGIAWVKKKPPTP